MAEPIDRMLTTPEAADRLGLAPGTLENWRCARRGPPFHKIGGAVRYSEGGLAAYKAATLRETEGGLDGLAS
jgi:hypothetical protein